MEKISSFVHSTDEVPPKTIGLSPINEYNKDHLFNMKFHVLFRIGDALPHQPCMNNIPLDIYAIHLM
jgi:hypothetical protein